MTTKKNTETPEKNTETPEKNTETPERNMPSDEELAAIMAQAQGVAPPPRKRTTVADNYVAMVTLVKTTDDLARHKPLSETGRIKLLEIAIMWALNNRTEADTSSVFGEGVNPEEEESPEEPEAMVIPTEVHEVPQEVTDDTSS